ncbi:unnamed protein product [Leuciscus chuanchicus]
MGPRKTPSMEDMEDIKKSLDFLGEEITAVRTQQKGILELFEEVKALRIGNAEKDQKIQRLEERVADLEQHTRMNDIVVTGLPIKPRSYAHAARAENREMEEQDNTPVEQQVATFLQTKGIDLDISNIEACQYIPRKNVKDKPIVILKELNMFLTIFSSVTADDPCVSVTPALRTETLLLAEETLLMNVMTVSIGSEPTQNRITVKRFDPEIESHQNQAGSDVTVGRIKLVFPFTLTHTHTHTPVRTLSTLKLQISQSFQDIRNKRFSCFV